GGKIKRGGLAAAFSKTQAADKRGGEMVSPRSELDCQLAGIWADLLDVDQVGVDQDVFALGVDSLAMTQMILRLEGCFGVDSSFEDIFNARSVGALPLRLESST